MKFGLMLRAQFPEGDDMAARFQELLEQARLADALGFDSITKGMHYSSPPWQSLQQLPFLSRVMAEAPRLRLNFGLILLSLHKPLDVAEQIATVDVMSGGKVIFGVALGYRDVEFLAFGTTQKERVRRFEENLEAVRRLWTEDSVDMVASHFTLKGASASPRPVQKPHPPIWIGANADPDRWVRLLHGPRRGRGALQGEVGRDHVDRVLGPQPPHGLQVLLEALHALLLRRAERQELDVAVAERDAEDDLAAAHHVDGCDLLGDVQRLVEREQDEPEIEPQPRRFCHHP